MLTTPKGLRLHIALFGRRNVGKSTILNSLTGQQVSIVSDVAGTTTDPVEKPLELLPLGPVVFIDTAGIDDVGALGGMRIEKTKKVFDRTDIALVIIDGETFGTFEEEIISELGKRSISYILVINKTDLRQPSDEFVRRFSDRKIPVAQCAAQDGTGILELKKMIIAHAPEDWINPPTLVGDLVRAGEMAVLVVPIDLEAPKGRLILPQVQVMREILDNDGMAMIVKERELYEALHAMHRPPSIVITDSQAVLKVCADVPPSIRVTTFSILFARYKGDLRSFVEGVFAIDSLKDGDKVLIGEACSHHSIGDDIGAVKIPRWIRQYTGKDLTFEKHSGHDFPDDLEQYKLIVHCGSCMFNRRAMLSRILHAQSRNVAITNYGIAISYLQGVLKRAVEPFPFVKYLVDKRKA
ncbi:MAG: [FeFe] hydrogenase H-cluster maturation GTPase HydF [Candidatus Auribacter fodinae]|uniref:[FeFe] hydrogenase H-cluster maturation GTPase HydF n=1 Tax=Candidatus Auribacter fodinae TaxID=2093366 RepID=A0A3A4QY05_9BACT|nr:MAG: [FeFe] hydrogenase H-cluster maturation GTPase HydF [Candidatus Auribacter fodinae]